MQPINLPDMLISSTVYGAEQECNEFGFVCVNCTSFRLCPDEGLPPDRDVQTCVSGLQCSMTSDLICDTTCNLPEFECTVAGRFPDPLTCRRYYICSPDNKTGGFFRFQYPCPGQSNFHPELKRCTYDPVPNCL